MLLIRVWLAFYKFLGVFETYICTSPNTDRNLALRLGFYLLDNVALVAVMHIKQVLKTCELAKYSIGC